MSLLLLRLPVCRCPRNSRTVQACRRRTTHGCKVGSGILIITGNPKLLGSASWHRSPGLLQKHLCLRPVRGLPHADQDRILEFAGILFRLLLFASVPAMSGPTRMRCIQMAKSRASAASRLAEPTPVTTARAWRWIPPGPWEHLAASWVLGKVST